MINIYVAYAKKLGAGGGGIIISNEGTWDKGKNRTIGWIVFRWQIWSGRLFPLELDNIRLPLFLFHCTLVDRL